MSFVRLKRSSALSDSPSALHQNALELDGERKKFLIGLAKKPMIAMKRKRKVPAIAVFASDEEAEGDETGSDGDTHDGAEEAGKSASQSSEASEMKKKETKKKKRKNKKRKKREEETPKTKPFVPPSFFTDSPPPLPYAETDRGGMDTTLNDFNDDGSDLSVSDSEIGAKGRYFVEPDPDAKALSCSICAGIDHLRGNCPNSRCWNCGELGHSAKFCRSVSSRPNFRPCSMCGGFGHTRNRCHNGHPPRIQAIQLSCFRCGARGHTGYQCTQ